VKQDSVVVPLTCQFLWLVLAVYPKQIQETRLKINTIQIIQEEMWHNYLLN
jgi:hypothetical protein